MVDYMGGLRAGEPWTHAARHMLGLRNGLPGRAAGARCGRITV